MININRNVILLLIITTTISIGYAYPYIGQTTIFDSGGARTLQGNVSINDSDGVTSKKIGNTIYANQYATLQNALTAGGNNSIVFIPAGTYTISTALTPYSNQTIYGAGSSTKIIINGNIDGISGSNLDSLTISNLMIQGGTQNGISLTQTTNSKLFNIEIYGASLKGISFTGGINNKVYNNYLHDIGQEGVSIAADVLTNLTTKDFWIYDNIFENNGAYNGIGTVTQSSSVYIQNVNIYNNYINGTNLINSYSIRLSGCFNCSVHDNTIIGGTNNQIELGINGNPQQRVKDTYIYNNHQYTVANGFYAVKFQMADNSTYINNDIHNSSGGMFSINGNENNIIQNNAAYNVRGPSVMAGTNNIAFQNYGISPFNFGNKTSTPTAYGAGDEFFYSVSNRSMLFRTVWEYILTNSSIIDGGNVTVIQNNNGTITISATVPVPTWTNLSLQNSWTNSGNPYADASYSMDGFGVVHLRGQVRSGTLGTLLATLPAGYRPLYRKEYVTYSTNGTALFTANTEVRPNGEIYVGLLSSGANADYSIEGITFETN